MTSNVVYAVKNGLNPGVYRTWEECKQQVIGVKGAIFKSFGSLEDAYHFIGRDDKALMLENTRGQMNFISVAFNDSAYIAGSFNFETRKYGYGVVINKDGKQYTLSGNGKERRAIELESVAGEIKGVIEAVLKAEELGVSQLNIYYSYIGVEKWAKGLWTRNNFVVDWYYKFLHNNKRNIILHFVKQKEDSKEINLAKHLAECEVNIL